MQETAMLRIGDREMKLPVVVGTEKERAIDIAKLRTETGYITLDEGYVNTARARARSRSSTARRASSATAASRSSSWPRSATSSRWPTC